VEALDKINREKEKIKSRLALIRKEVLVDADAVGHYSKLWFIRATANAQICATCLSSVKADLDVIDFPIVFLDEASMATEPLSWLPLSKGVCLLHFTLP
jgi:superfamily I DNA and/or RNA helicase